MKNAVKPYTYYQALLGRKVLVKTVNEGMKGTVIDYDMSNSSVILDVRLENGFLLEKVREVDIEVIGDEVQFHIPQGSAPFYDESKKQLL